MGHTIAVVLLRCARIDAVRGSSLFGFPAPAQAGLRATLPRQRLLRFDLGVFMPPTYLTAGRGPWAQARASGAR